MKLYQGVTLGALSFPRDAAGNIIRGMKRHPTLEDDVVVYANATILGGDTVIGHHAVIGSNVWLTHCVAPHTAGGHGEAVAANAPPRGPRRGADVPYLILPRASSQMAS